jgi:cupin fold WbuC family metalloprotein
MKIFSTNYMNELSVQAMGNPRKRQHRNIHLTYQDACQRLFNAIEPGSYIRPHRHSTDPRDELLIAIRGSMALVTFDEFGVVSGVLRFGYNKHRDDWAVGAEVAASTWHTVIALETGSVLLEVKAGPFDPDQPKDMASWAPEEGTKDSSEYLRQLTDSLSICPSFSS